MKALIILRGVPGCGKSTAAEILALSKVCKDTFVFEKKDTICTADDYFTEKYGSYKWSREEVGAAHKWCQDKCREAMKNGEDRIFVANTNTRLKEMKVYYDMAKEYGYMVISLVVENRHDGKNEHNVPAETITAMKDRFEVKL